MPRIRAQQKRSPSPAQALLAWYDVNRRALPWRARRGEKANPYRVWLSEIMLQQTTVAAVAPYFRTFLQRWPTIEDLAAAELDAVLAAWAGLGYYARARNLHRTAQNLASEFGGLFPQTADGLRVLPGIGQYTAAAIAAIAFERPEAAIDANAERVIARVFAIDEPMPGAKTIIRAHGRSLVPETRAGDFAQALMDLGAGICTPKRPACPACPWRGVCGAYKKGIQERLPVRAPERARPLRRGAAFVACDGEGAVLLVRRPSKGLLGAMLQPPLGPWSEDFPAAAEAMAQAPFRASWKKCTGIVRHGFTHFELEVEAYVVEIKRRPVLTGADARWVATERLREVALPTVMRKIVAHALKLGPPQARSARSR